MGRNTLKNILISIILISTITLGLKKFNILNFFNFATPQESSTEMQLNQNKISTRMTYGRFLEYLEMGWIKQVDLYDNSRNAIVQAASPELGNRPQTLRVEIENQRSHINPKTESAS